MKNITEFVRFIIKLKQVKRNGWIRKKINNVESVADHSYGVCLLAFILSKLNPEKLDRKKCLKIALIHDLAESKVGDITPHDNISLNEKFKKEKKAIQEICSILDDNEILDLWCEYESKETPEARFIKDLDVLETVFQALEYERQNKGRDINLEDFWTWAQKNIKGEFVKLILKQLVIERGTIE